MSTSLARIRLGAVALAVAGALFVLYPAVRPWEDESTVDGAVDAMSSGAWIASHLFAMIGFILLALGMLALQSAVSHTRAEPLAQAAAVTTMVGAGLTLPYFGAETYGLNAIATEVQPASLLDTVDAFRFHPVAVTTFALGLLAIAAGAILAAVAIWRCGIFPRYAGVLFALGFALFIPQFFTPGPVRIAHGVLVGFGSAWVAFVLWRTPAGSPPSTR